MRRKVFVAVGFIVASAWMLGVSGRPVLAQGPKGGQVEAPAGPAGRQPDEARWSEPRAVPGAKGVRCVAFSQDGEKLAAGDVGDKTSYGKVQMWDADSLKLLRTFEGHRGEIGSVAFSPDGKRLASGGTDTLVKIWDAESGDVILTLKGHRNEVVSVAFSPDGKRLASGSWAGSVKVWDAERGRELLDVEAPARWIYEARMSPDGTRVVVAGPAAPGGGLNVWDVRTGRRAPVLKGHEDRVLVAGFTPGGDRIVSAGLDGAIKAWDARTGREIPSLQSDWWTPARGDKAAISSDGRVILTEGRETLAVWDAESGKEVYSQKGSCGFGSKLEVSCDGTQVAWADVGDRRAWVMRLRRTSPGTGSKGKERPYEPGPAKSGSRRHVPPEK